MKKSERDKLRDKAHHLQEWEDYKHFLELLDYVDRLEDALKFYADKDNWDEENALGQTPSCWDDGHVDLGNRARQALEGNGE